MTAQNPEANKNVVHNYPLPLNTKIANYEIIKHIARGGFGFVYLAKNEKGQEVAIKEYLPVDMARRPQGEKIPQVIPEKLNLYRLAMKSFFDEGRALARVDHPSVVKILDFLLENETVYMVMNYLKGISLQDYIISSRQKNKGQDFVLRQTVICHLFEKILFGLRIVHQNKILHLDIKPANIIITNKKEVVMIDFGAAREAVKKDNNERPIYTPGFAAPEMYTKNGQVGPWSDIYSIGACMYACMVGYPPKDVPTRSKFDDVYEKMINLRPLYTKEFIDLTAWSLSFKIDKRPQSVFELQQQLREIVDQLNRLKSKETWINTIFKAI